MSVGLPAPASSPPAEPTAERRVVANRRRPVDAVCHISTVHAQADDRIFYKECAALRDEGYRVFLVVGHDKADEVDGIRVVPLPPARTRLQRVLVNGPRAFLAALRTRARVCHFHDPELLGVGVLLRLCGRKVVYDSHENVEAQISSKQWIGQRWVRRIVARLFRGIELVCCLFLDRVISVTPEIVARFPAGKGVLVRNLPILSAIPRLGPRSGPASRPVRIVYAGGLTRIRGIHEAIQALDAVEDAELWLLGPWESEDYRRRCEALPAWGRVRYLGVKKLTDVYALLPEADIGIALLYPEENYLQSLPVKAFEYMAAGLPIVMSNFPYWRANFDGAALFADPFSPRDIAAQLNRLLHDHDLFRKLSDQGQTLVAENFSWESERRTLLGMYEELCHED
jgi:glycosyltransferase involved in cell wall biosynthesis